MTNKRVLQAALAEPWAITAEGLETVLAIAARENVVTPEALEAYRSERVANTQRLQTRGRVGILEVSGPMFRRANIFTAISGGASYDSLALDFQKALDDPAIQSIVLNMDTPGGEVTGVDEFAKAIRAGRERKRIVAYVGGMGASAGYWLASQAHEIIAADTAMLGSIGVRATYQDTSKKDEAAGNVEFISSQSPGKRSDISSDEGKARVQRTIDALADVFLTTVAKGRGREKDDVIANFGGGDVLIGAAAVAAGMADRLGTFEGVLAELAGRGPSSFSSVRNAKVTDISKADHDIIVAKAVADATATATVAGATGERARIGAILALDDAKGRETTALHLALTTDLSAAAMPAVLAGIPAQAEAPAAAPAAPQGLRAKDAPNGLVAFEPNANEKPANPFAGVVAKLNKA